MGHVPEGVGPTHYTLPSYGADALADITKREIKEWIRGLERGRRPQTVKNILNLLRVILTTAVDDDIVDENVARDVRVTIKNDRTSEERTVLSRDELDALCAQATDEERLLILFAVGSGLRQGEQRSLLLSDVHLDEPEPHASVRHGKPGRPTKSGKPRRVPLFALDAARRWKSEFLPRIVDNDRGLFFPTMRGAVRPEGRMRGRVCVGKDEKTKRPRYVERFHQIATNAGLFAHDEARPLVWHSLRHTFATWLADPPAPLLVATRHARRRSRFPGSELRAIARTVARMQRVPGGPGPRLLRQVRHPARRRGGVLPRSLRAEWPMQGGPQLHRRWPWKGPLHRRRTRPRGALHTGLQRPLPQPHVLQACALRQSGLRDVDLCTSCRDARGRVRWRHAEAADDQRVRPLRRGSRVRQWPLPSGVQRGRGLPVRTRPLVHDGQDRSPPQPSGRVRDLQELPRRLRRRQSVLRRHSVPRRKVLPSDG